jgi:hypothetical protein
MFRAASDPRVPRFTAIITSEFALRDHSANSLSPIRLVPASSRQGPYV